MSRHKPQRGEKGSLKRIQDLINSAYPGLLDKLIADEFKFAHPYMIEWKSPLKDDDYAEYRDSNFLERLGLQHLCDELKKFWPAKGPQWDALGVGKDKKVFIVEAKANVPEMVSGPTGASPAPLKKIQKAMDELKRHLKSKSKTDWTHFFYQYTNRLAHLYFLRAKNKVPAYLVFVYFLNDETVDGPKTEEEWKAAIQVMHKYLGLGRSDFLKKWVGDIFIDVKYI